MGAQSAVIHILVADDHPNVRAGWLQCYPPRLDFLVVGEAGTGIEVVDQVMTLDPDIVLLTRRCWRWTACKRWSGCAVRASRCAPLPSRRSTPTSDSERGQAGAKGLSSRRAREELFNAVRSHAGGIAVTAPGCLQTIQRMVDQTAAAECRKHRPRARWKFWSVGGWFAEQRDRRPARHHRAHRQVSCQFNTGSIWGGN